MRMGAAVAGDQTAEELKKVGVVADGQHAFAVGVFSQQRLEIVIACVGPEGGADLDFGVVAELGAHELRGLQGALQRAGDDDIHLHLEGAEDARHQHALFLAFFDEAALGVEKGFSRNTPALAWRMR
jgi:hypothetical protein